MESDAEEPLLARVVGERGEVEEGRREEVALLDHADAARLLEDEEAARPVARVGHLDGMNQAGGDDAVQVEFELGGRRLRRSHLLGGGLSETHRQRQQGDPYRRCGL